jgi:hypothetical protein
VRKKANIEYLQRLTDFPENYPAKPVDISNFIKIDFDPLTQFNQLKQYQHVFNKDEDQDDPFPKSPTTQVLENYKLKEPQPDVHAIAKDTPPPLISRQDGYCSSSNDEDSHDDGSSTDEDNIRASQTKRWGDFSNHNAPASNEDDAQALLIANITHLAVGSLGRNQPKRAMLSLRPRT